MKRFYKQVAIGDGGAILLDGRAVRTPAGMPLALPTSALAEAVGGEWRAQGDTIEPKSMSLTALANAAIDRAVPDPSGFARPLVAYAETDLLCYRAEAPPALIAAEAAAWDPLLDWARGRYDIAFDVASGIVHRPQPTATIARLTEALTAREAFALSAFAPLITIGGSLVTALAVAEGAIAADAAFDATHVDELWQAEQWGEDWMATEHRAARRKDFIAASAFLDLLRG